MPKILLSLNSGYHRPDPALVPPRRYCKGATPIVFWHLLSLDAPTVAVIWTIFTATVTHTVLPLATPLAMALAVWILYAADRLLDTRHLCASGGIVLRLDLEQRHLFHHRHRFAFLGGIAVASIVLATLLPQLPIPAIRLYVAEGSVMAGYFLMIHTAPSSTSASSHDDPTSARRMPKEILVGPLFAAAVFIPTVSRNPGLQTALLPFAVLFAALCSMNCLYIYQWEHAEGAAPAWVTMILLRHLGRLSAAFFAISVLFSLVLHLNHQAVSTLKFYPLACAASTLILLALHRFQQRFSSITLRAFADAALLTPLIILPLLSRYRG